MSLVFFLMIRRPPRSTRTDTSFPTRRSSDLLNVVPEIKTAPEQVEALKRTRTGIIMGIDLLTKYGWKIGDRVSLHSTISVRKDDGSSNWPFDIVGTYIFQRDESQTTGAFFNYTYFEDERTFGNGKDARGALTRKDP